MKRHATIRLALAAALTLSVAVAVPAAAQSQPRPKPKDLEKIDDVPPPPNVLIEPRDTKVDPNVTVVDKDGAKHEEFRVRGKLYKVRVTPENGPAYWLVDSKGDGNFARIDSAGLAPNNAVPMWVLKEW